MSRIELSPSKQRLRLWLKLLRLTRGVEAELRERLRVNYGATLPRFDVMAALFRADEARADHGLTMTELSRALMVSNGNVTGIIERLVEDGFVQRRPDETDRRTTFVQLTEAGKAAFQDMAKAHEGWVNDLLSPLAPAEVDHLIEVLNAHRAARTTPE
ncbi:MarR family winged helix-turn-helix transcriptional regulator [Novispirillum itersonii]|uniref:DNA-binding MarR family transcriptional regulator n=1 Tax=Novispirillum itersonii TaxID=189 RepID=A0A7W9ZG99_NOVIT|nr:MarR family transcriptional regulator [Novispirillum itersonii]MBB6210971.1 DNA-binding MarR family transcriptional regulator [Novispirillum itersonii]